MARKSSHRDDFLAPTRRRIARRAGYLCSLPTCRRSTIGATSDGNGEIHIGVAAHICAAAEGGPRYDAKMTPEERSSAENGIWLCQDHAKAVDSIDPDFTVERLRMWKAQAQRDSWQRVLHGDGTSNRAGFILPAEASLRVRKAAAADLDAFRRSGRWPKGGIALTLEVEGLNEPISTAALAAALVNLDDLVVVAPPGTGKTTTLFQIAEALLAGGHATPVIVPLGAWSTGNESLLQSVLQRQPFRGLAEDDLRAVAARPGVVLLLDGWNELDSPARLRAATEVTRLSMDLPELGLVIATRKQTLDVPVNGQRVSVLPLCTDQQRALARAAHGDAGGRILDQAWRTPGVRELVTIPLYLESLLALPPGSPFPTTKEEVLRRFVAAHESDLARAEALARVTLGLHQSILEHLAATATRAANTTIADAAARRSVADAENLLVTDGQLTDRPQPPTVLEALVSHHVLMRGGDPPGYSFHHQQIQEWYASYSVEHTILSSTLDTATRQRLRAEILDLPVWEEPLLFACERMSRDGASAREACADAIREAFAVDPMLAAEMIYRSTDIVWEKVAAEITAAATAWHKPGKLDRSLRFMLATGRPEFLDQVWPLIANDNPQMHLRALRAVPRFRTRILGNDATGRLASLRPDIRKNVLLELASNSGVDGLDLASRVAAADPDPEIKASVVAALAFRRADWHVEDILRSGDKRTFDLVALQGMVGAVGDPDIDRCLRAARERASQSSGAYEQLHAIAYPPNDEDRSENLAPLIATMELGKRENDIAELLYVIRNRHPRPVAEGLLQRVRDGRALPAGAQGLIVTTGIAVEAEAVLEIALSTKEHDARADAAMSALGPRAVGQVIDRLLEALGQVREPEWQYRKEAKLCSLLRARLQHSSPRCLVAAVRAHADTHDCAQIAELAGLIARHPVGREEGGPFGEEEVAVIASLTKVWGERLLASGQSRRGDLAALAEVVLRAPKAELLPLLKKLLEEDLRRWRAAKAARAAAWAVGLRDADASNDAHMSWVLQYQRAFSAIADPLTTELMVTYLSDGDFGHSAAQVLKAQWLAANEPIQDAERWRSGPEFSAVAAKRIGRRIAPPASSFPADVIFAEVENLIAPGASMSMKSLGVTLGIVGVSLPHGQRDGTIAALLSIAEGNQRAAFLSAMVFSGEAIDIQWVRAGISEVLEAAKTQAWLLTDNQFRLDDWLRLLPFAAQLDGALATVQSVLDQVQGPWRPDALLESCGLAPGDEAENLLFDLARADSRLYASQVWLDAVERRRTLSAANRLVGLIAGGAFDGSNAVRGELSDRVARQLREHAALRFRVYELFQSGATAGARQILARAIADSADADGLLLLVRHQAHGRGSEDDWHRAAEKVVTRQEAVEGWRGAFNVLPVPALELRRKLLAMTTDGGPTDEAAACLRAIDRIRDEVGAPDTEPRHPDLASGKPWPIIGSLKTQ